jgi:hypothetical protein
MSILFLVLLSDVLQLAKKIEMEKGSPSLSGAPVAKEFTVSQLAVNCIALDLYE